MTETLVLTLSPEEDTEPGASGCVIPNCEGKVRLLGTVIESLTPILESYILSRGSEAGSPTNHPGLPAATRHGVRDPLVRSKVDKTYVGASM